MNDITLHINNNTSATCVPNAFIDELMAGANGEFVKIYLYLLRCMNSSDDFSISKMADKFEHTEKDIKRALKYWEKMHVLQLEYDSNNQLSGICLIDSASGTSAMPEPTAATVPAAGITVPVTDTLDQAASTDNTASATANKAAVISMSVPAVSLKRPAYSKNEVLAFQKEHATADLFFVIESYIGHPLSANDYETIMYWYDVLLKSTDLIEYLVESCVEKGHKNIRYMDKVAIAWAEASIQTVDDAKKASGIHNQTYYGIMKAFGISGRNLAEYELNLVDKWMNTFGFSLDIITEACKRTIQATSQPSFQYADTILENWKKSNVHHLEDIAVLDSAHKKSKAGSHNIQLTKSGTPNNRFNNYSQRAYNYDQLEKQLLNSSTQ